MKTKNLYSAVFAFILSSLLASCTFLQKAEFAQRKYYNFPHVKNSVQGVPDEHVSTASVKTVTEKISVKDETPVNGGVTTASTSVKQVPAVVKETRSEKRAIGSAAVIEDKLKSEPVVSLKRKDVFKIAHERSTRSDSDVMLIVELILAIFIPPLAVWIHRGSITKWFWITLLLCLLGGVFIGMTY